MLKIAVVDDDEEILQMVQEQIDNCIEVSVETSLYTRTDILLFDVNDGKEFDVYFLDIEMDQMNGLDLAKIIREKQGGTKIIFLTSHQEFALASYDVNIQTYQYILKNSMEEKLPKIMKAIVNEMKQPHFYSIQNQLRFTRIVCADVVYMRKEGKYVVIVTPNGEYRERKTLNQVVRDMKLQELISIERGYVANILHIQHIRNNVIEMDNGDELFISRSKIRKVKMAVNEYWSNVL